MVKNGYPKAILAVLIMISVSVIAGSLHLPALAGVKKQESPTKASHELYLSFSAEEKQWIEDHPVVVARVGNAPPLHFFEGTCKGISVDYLNAIAAHAGFQVRYETGIPWSKALNYLKHHDKIDILLTAKITAERRKDMAFTENYLFMPLVIFSRIDTGFISRMEDLRHKTISIERGYALYDHLVKHFPDIDLFEMDTSEDAIDAVATGKADAYIGNLTISSYIIQKNNLNNVKVAAPTPLEDHNQAMAIRNDWPELVGIINKTLAFMTQDEHAVIRNKWLSIRYEYGIDKVYVLKWVLSVTGIAFFIIGFVLFWNRRLKSEVILRKKTEKKLKRQRDLFKLVINSVPARIFWKDLTLEYLGCNIHFAKDSGMEKPEDVTGKDDYDFVWKEDADVYRADDKHVISTGKSKLMYEESFFNKEGEKIWWLTNKMPLKNYDGEIIGVIAITENITEWKKTRKEKQKLETQLQQSQKMESIGNLAGGIAHDFNNILSSVIGFTELALDEVKKGSSIEDSLQEVYVAGKRARDLVKQILAFARQSDENLKPIQVDHIIKEVLKFIRSSIPTTIKISQNIDSCSPIMGNATQVYQIMMNLCTNAAHAMEEKGGTLEVCLQDIVIEDPKDKKLSDLKSGSYIEISVSDTGAGIPSDILESIFEPYFTTKGVGEGTGMGLAMVHGIVETYNGKITVESNSGKGTIFKIYLPVTGQRSEIRPYETDVLPFGTEKILFVDDEAPIAKIGSQILESLGYSVITRTNSVEALELFRSKPNDFDLVITDMTMPNMTGDELTAELINIRSDIPVILCTGYSKKISGDSFAEMGIKAFAYKPVVKADLVNTVRRVLDEAKAKDQQ